MRVWEIRVWKEVADKAEAEAIDVDVQAFFDEHPDFSHNANYRVLEKLEQE